MHYRHTVDISDIHKGYRDGAIEAKDIGPMLAERLEKGLLPEVVAGRLRRELKVIIAGLRECADIDQYDAMLEQLYDWADARMLNGRLCWVNSFVKQDAI